MVLISNQTAIVKNLVLELRRGTLTLCVLSQLRNPQYGYSLLKLLSKQGVGIDQNKLYPLLRRLEEQGLLVSSWSVEDTRPRRYYKLSESGRLTLKVIIEHWQQLVDTVENLITNSEAVADGTN